jgi:uncharacterized protein YsxB (DUF464 family)
VINITISIKNDDYNISANGHALFNPGNDIVCSAVSALFYAFAGFLHNNSKVRRADVHLESGDAKIKASGDIKQAFDVFVIGLLQIEKSYPDNIKIDLT